MNTLKELTVEASRRIPPVRAVAALTVGVVIAIVVATALLLWDLHEREEAHARGEIISLSKILAEQTTRSFDGIDLVLRGVQDRLADGIGQKLSLDSSMVFFLLRARVTSLPQVASVFIIDANGDVLNSSRGASARGHSVRDQPFFSVWREGYQKELFVGHPARSRIDGRWSLYLSRPLLDMRGDLRGVVVANVDLGHFESLYSSISLDFVSPIFLTLADGSLLVSQPPNEAAIGKSVINPALDIHVKGQGNDLKVIREPGVRTVAYRTVSNFPLAVGVAIGDYEAMTPWRNVATQISTGALLVALLIALAGWLLAREMRREERLAGELEESNRQLRELSVALQEVREDERTRIARELHDELGQKLTGLRLELSWLSGRIRAVQPELADKVEAMKGQLSDTLEEVRRISSELRPLMLDDLGFAAAAEWTVQEFSRRTGLAVRLDMPDAEAVRDGAQATTLFRVLQESLTNVARHAEATEVRVLLYRRADTLTLRIEDNGRGLPPVPGKGFGLIGMRERVAALGGRFSCTGEVDGGVCVEVVLPMATVVKEEG